MIQELLAYLGSLVLSGGDHDGEKLILLPWEKRFVRGAFRVPGDAALSVARGNGKSAIVAGIACAVVDPDGPLHGRRREVTVIASSFQQGRIVFEDAREFMREKYGDELDRRALWRLRDSTNEATLEHRKSGARIRCIGSDPKRAHGLRPMLALCDEPAQWAANQRDAMLAAVRTGLGKVPGSRLIALGTRAADPLHWFSKLLVDAEYSQVHAAQPKESPLTLRAIRRANPSFDHLPSLAKRILQERDEARRDSSLLASFESLRLNKGVSDTEVAVLLDADVWAELLTPTVCVSGEPVWGVDLGTSAAQSAVASYWPETMALKAFACFPEQPGLSERGRNDGVADLYRRCAARNELVTFGHRVSDVSMLLTEAYERFGQPSAIAVDSWRYDELLDVLDKTPIRKCPIIKRGMGFRDGGEDVRDFRRACVARKVRVEENLLLTHAMSEARVLVDPTGTAKLAKNNEGGRRSRARDDTAAAAILAVGVGSRNERLRRRPGVRIY